MQDALGRQHIVTVWCLKCQIWGCSGTHKGGTEGISLRSIYKLNHAHKRDHKRKNSNHWAISGGLLFGYFVSMQSVSLADLLYLMHESWLSALQTWLKQIPWHSRWHFWGKAPGHRFRSSGDTSRREKRCRQVLEQTQCSYPCTCSLPRHQVLVTLQKINENIKFRI